MSNDIYNKYYNYKIKTVFRYSILLSKIIGIKNNKLWTKKKYLEESLDFIINDYFSNNSNISTIKIFINDENIFKYGIEREVASIINYFIARNRAFDISSYEKEIVLAASIIHIANNLERLTSPFIDKKNNYKTILMNYLIRFNKISFFNLIDDTKKNINLLLEEIKESVKKERKIFEVLNSNISFNKYIEFSNNNYYLTQYYYSIPGIEDCDIEAVNYINEKDNIDNKFISISIDLVIVTLMKLLSVRDYEKIIFLPIRYNFFESEDNLNIIKKIYEDKIISNHLKLLVKNDEFNNNIKELLDSYNISYYIFCDDDTLNDNMIIGNNYLITNNYANKNMDYINRLKDNNCNIVIGDLNEILSEEELINKRKED